MDTTPQPRQWRNRLSVRLSVRTLMILVLVLGGWFGWIVHRARVQRDAVAAIRKARGSVIYYEDFADGRTVKTPWPNWLVDTVGRDCLSNVFAVYLYGGPGFKVDDTLMADVGRLKRLEHLRLDDCNAVTDVGLAHISRLVTLKTLAGASPLFTDAGLAHLKGLVNLQELFIGSPKITSAGLDALHDMKLLRGLNLSNSAVTDLAPIRHLSGLTVLSLYSTKIVDAGLTHLRGLTALTDLYLHHTAITDAGLAHLSGLTKLRTLNLNDTSVGDAGLPYLAGLNQVTSLFLQRTRITDAGLAHLEGLKSCVQIEADGTKVTDAGIKEARKNHPKIRFHR